MKIRFGTSGWRGIIAEDFTFEGVERVTQAIARYLKSIKSGKKPVMVGYDTRFLSPEFARVVAEVLAGNNIPVLFSKSFCPTPVVSFIIMKKKLSGGINITASHNPAPYNGLKFSPASGAPAPTAVTKQIEKLIEKISIKNVKKMIFEDGVNKGLIKSVKPKKDYITQLHKLVDFNKIKSAKLKVRADSMFGTSSEYLFDILKDFTDIKVINDFRDPLFGGHSSEPDAENLSDLSKLVKKDKADIGIATDGDADRFGIVDEKGRFIPPNMVISMLLQHLVKNKKLKGGVVRTIATTHLIDEISRLYKIDKIYETPVGFKYIGEKMLAEDIIIGGEESGGLSIFSHIPEKDGILADLLMIEMIAYEKKSISEILKNLFKKIPKPVFNRLDLAIKPDLKDKILAEFEKLKWNEIMDKKLIKKDTRDGLKLVFHDKSWILIRPSGTEPKLRIYIEAVKKKDLMAIEKNILALIG